MPCGIGLLRLDKTYYLTMYKAGRGHESAPSSHVLNNLGDGIGGLTPKPPPRCGSKDKSVAFLPATTSAGSGLRAAGWCEGIASASALIDKGLPNPEPVVRSEAVPFIRWPLHLF